MRKARWGNPLVNLGWALVDMPAPRWMAISRDEEILLHLLSDVGEWIVYPIRENALKHVLDLADWFGGMRLARGEERNPPLLPPWDESEVASFTTVLVA